MTARGSDPVAAADNVYSAYTALALRTGAVNLGQGFPDDPAPADILERARTAIADGLNQYPPTRGVSDLREAVSGHQLRRYGVHLDPRHEVVVTTGASEAITATLLGLLRPGDEVLLIDPCYDLYPHAVRLVGGRAVHVSDVSALARSVTPRTRAIVINSPGNPSGEILSREEIHEVGTLAQRYDLVVISDEVYEHIVLGATSHICAHEEPLLGDRTVVVSSAAKTFCVTGWKVGWATGPRWLIDEVHRVKQYLSFASGTPFQYAVAAALENPEVYTQDLCRSYRDRCDLLTGALERFGYTVSKPDGGYFVLADAAPLGVVSTEDLHRHCESLPRDVGIVGIPGSVFSESSVSTVRFCFAKSRERVEEACSRLDHSSAKRT